MKNRFLIYINKDDPRTFVYKHQKYKWFGVTLNFAHSRSSMILLLTLILFADLALPHLLIADRAAAELTFLILLAGDLFLVCFYYFHHAAEDLRRYPGALADRE